MMSRVRVASFSISADGFGAGPNQTLETPLGIGGESLHTWLVETQMFHAMSRKEGGSTGVDNDYALRGFENLGAWILGRNMFGPVRGPWPDESWKGWWGKNPPYHCPVFVLTHHARAPLEMEGGTVFHFVTGGIHEALDRARSAAGGKGIRIGGGVSTIHQYLREGLIDDMHVAVSPILLGSGERLFEGVDLKALGYECTSQVGTPLASHVEIRKK